MSEYGVTATGFVVKPRAVILSELQDAAILQEGPGTDVSSDSVRGIQLGLMADAVAGAWEQAYLTYTQCYPDGATGASFAAIARFTACDRLQPTASLIDVVLSGVAGTTVPSGTVFSSGPGTHTARTQEAAVLVGGAAAVRLQATETGPLPFYAGYLTAIDTPVPGLAGVAQANDAVYVGIDLESEISWRTRRETSLRLIGGASVDGIRAKVLDVKPSGSVAECYVYDNDTEVMVDGLPPHSFEVVASHVDDSTAVQQAIGDAVLASKPAGIYSHGQRTIVCRDTGGAQRTVRYTRPTEALIYVSVGVSTDGTETAIDLINAVKAAVVAQESTYKAGNNVVSSRLERALWISPCIYDLDVRVGTVPSPVGYEVVLTRREIASFDTSRIVVTITHAIDT